MNSIKQWLLLLCSILSFTSICLTQETISAKVVGVVDGDTITVLTKDKRQMMLRLAGIDAPEKEQDYGANARQFLSGLILNQTVTVSGIKEDCHKRLAGSVAFNKNDLSLLAIKSGNAWADSSCQVNEALVKEESAVKEKKLGLWQNPNPMRPNDFLQSNREQSPAVTSQAPARRIFSGIAPAPPPIMTADGKLSDLYIGMTFSEFLQVCGDSGKKSSMSVTENRVSFSIVFADSEENKDKGCHGRFGFEKNPTKVNFEMWFADQ